ncbi:hypothetical protein JCM10213_005371, partial [Rhodosporidiobolus nylandii]
NDIPVNDLEEETVASNAFYNDLPLDGEVRLSATFLKTLERPNQLFAAAPVGFELGRKYSLATRVARTRTYMTAVTKPVLNAYAGNVMEFLAFCVEEGIEPKERFPAASELIVNWLTRFVGQYTPGTIRKKYDSLAFWHAAHSQPFLVDKLELKRVYRAAANQYPKETEQRPGIVIEDMLAVWEVLDKRGQDKPEESGYYKAVKACSGTNFF